MPNKYIIFDPEYDEALDPAIALLYGPTDLGEKHESILRDEIEPDSGWTQKETDTTKTS